MSSPSFLGIGNSVLQKVFFRLVFGVLSFRRVLGFLPAVDRNFRTTRGGKLFRSSKIFEAYFQHKTQKMAVFLQPIIIGKSGSL
jgi:hypothetical protein